MYNEHVGERESGMFVCLFVYVAALPTHSSQGASEVKDTCLHLVKEFRKGEWTAQHICVRVD